MTIGDRYRYCRAFGTDTSSDGASAPEAPRWRILLTMIGVAFTLFLAIVGAGAIFGFVAARLL